MASQIASDPRSDVPVHPSMGTAEGAAGALSKKKRKRELRKKLWKEGEMQRLARRREKRKALRLKRRDLVKQGSIPFFVLH